MIGFGYWFGFSRGRFGIEYEICYEDKLVACGTTYHEDDLWDLFDDIVSFNAVTEGAA